MHIQANFSLRNLNTFGLDVTTKHYASIQNIHDLQTLLQQHFLEYPNKLILGGGSNLLMLDEYFDGLVVHILNKGIRVLHENKDQVTIRAYAGENWHALVMKSIEMGLSGLENLSLIPGHVGAAPMQNIGAYGVEFKDVFQRLEAVEVDTGQVVTFDAAACQFGYRSSVFKTTLKNRYVILSVDLLLHKTPQLKLEYGSLQQELKLMGLTSVGAKEVSEAVCRIRRSKLPDPEVLGNAGSFFKNPVVPMTQYEELKTQHPGLIAYPESDQSMKLAAGWLIEKAGWKGVREGDAGMHAKQALVLVNHGKATGRQLHRLAMKVRQSVSDHFGVLLEPEVNIIGADQP